MSQENVEVAKQSIEAFARRDVETMRTLNDAEVELDWTASRGVEAARYRGFDEVLRFYTGFFEAFEEIVFDELSFIDAGELIIAPNVSRSRGRDGIEVFARSAIVFTVNDRKITRVCLHQSTEQALESVGLAE